MTTKNIFTILITRHIKGSR